MPVSLEVTHHDELHEIADVERWRRRIEAAIVRNGIPVENSRKLFPVGGLVDESAPLQLLHRCGEAGIPVIPYLGHDAPSVVVMQCRVLYRHVPRLPHRHTQSHLLCQLMPTAGHGPSPADTPTAARDIATGRHPAGYQMAER